jgi:hypothetical protein
LEVFISLFYPIPTVMKEQESHAIIFVFNYSLVFVHNSVHTGRTETAIYKTIVHTEISVQGMFKHTSVRYSRDCLSERLDTAAVSRDQKTFLHN